MLQQAPPELLAGDELLLSPLGLVAGHQVPHGGGQHDARQGLLPAQLLEEADVGDARAADAVVGDVVQIDDSRQLDLVVVGLLEPDGDLSEDFRVGAGRVVEPRRVDEVDVAALEEGGVDADGGGA